MNVAANSSTSWRNSNNMGALAKMLFSKRQTDHNNITGKQDLV